ncbi:MAG: peptidylprolyl isomerase [Vulcanimicrobiaceae bacterium]
MVKRVLPSLLQAAALLLCSSAAAAPPSPYVQIEQLEQARSLGGDRLASFLNGTDRLVAIRAALAIGRTKQLTGISLLRAHVRDRDNGLRAMAVYGLGLIGTPSAAPQVVSALADRHVAVRLAAYDAVGRLEAGGALSPVQEASASKALAFDLQALPDPIARARAATALEAFQKGPRAGAISQVLPAAYAREPDANVRWHIVWAVYRGYAIRVPRSMLTRALHDSNEIVRIEAVRALGRVKSADAIASLIPMLHDPSWRVQEQAIESIKALRAQPLTEHLKALEAGVDPPAAQSDPLAALPALSRTAPGETPARPTAQEALYEPKIDPSSVTAFTGPAKGPHPRMRIVTTKGNIYVKLYPEWAQLTVANFMGLANRGYYDGNPWFRIVPDFVVQTGDPTGNGEGDAGYTIPAEENPLEQDSYVISMGLNYTDPPNAHAIRDSAGTQFYITLSPQLHLDRDFTVFGRVIGGIDVLGRLIESDKIVRVERIADSEQ